MQYDSITSSLNSTTVEPSVGHHYFGVVQDHLEDSLAEISISEFEISGIIQLGDT